VASGVGGGSTEFDGAGAGGGGEQAPSSKLSAKLWLYWTSISMGGSVFDGSLLAASQEVGQSILTLPNVFSLLGSGAGMTLELAFATAALCTNYLDSCTQ